MIDNSNKVHHFATLHNITKSYYSMLQYTYIHTVVVQDAHRTRPSTCTVAWFRACVCVCACARERVCCDTSACMRAWVPVCVGACVRACMCACVHLLYVCVRVYRCVWSIHACALAHVHAYVCARACACACVRSCVYV